MEDEEEEENDSDNPTGSQKQQHQGTTNYTAGTETGGGNSGNRTTAISKRRRVTEATMATAGASPSTSFQDFYRQGAKFKTLLDDAMGKVASTLVTAQRAVNDVAGAAGAGTTAALSTKNPNDDDSSATNATARDALSAHALLHKLAREKQTENLVLQQKLEQQQSETVTLEVLMKDLQETKAQQATQISRLTVALKQASENASRARYAVYWIGRSLRTMTYIRFLISSPYFFLHREDADAAESKSLALVTKVEALELVVAETKRASQLLLEEQQQVTQGAQGMEMQFMQVQTDLARSNAAQQKMQQDKRKLERRLAQLQDNLQEATRDLEQEKSKRLHWKRQTEELQAKETIQQERMNRLEQELQESKTLLVDATSAAAETKLAKQEVQAALDRMEEANQELHRQLQVQQQLLRTERESHQQALAQIQKDHQTTQHKLSAERDLVQSLKVEKQAADKKVSQLLSKLANLERRLKDTTNLMSAATHVGDTSAVMTSQTASDVDKQSTNLVAAQYVIPRLGGEKENPANSPDLPPPSSKCSICFKDASGLMKKCECGSTGCQIRAHAMCVQHITTNQAGTSVSHPGTPAPRLPVVLCASAKATGMASGDNTNFRNTLSRLSSVAPVTPAATNPQMVDKETGDCID
jgi:hypothetical protein